MKSKRGNWLRKFIEKFKYLNALAVECSRLIASFIKGLKNSKFEGLQSKRVNRDEEFDKWLETQNNKQNNV